MLFRWFGSVFRCLSFVSVRFGKNALFRCFGSAGSVVRSNLGFTEYQQHKVGFYCLLDKVYCPQGDSLENSLIGALSGESSSRLRNFRYCPRCKKHQQGMKKIELYSLPVILIIHLKRFSNTDKIERFIEYPLR
jgi:Ubiquitin carboxyl-terminal hydrolase